MNEARARMKSNGIFLISLPIGPDLVVWNLQRRYGRIRLPKMLEGFDILFRLGWKDEYIDTDHDYRNTIEPVFVLKQKTVIDNEL